jgi:hypothetical protein
VGRRGRRIPTVHGQARQKGKVVAETINTMISDDARRTIDNLSREELVNEINRQNRSRFQCDNHAYLKTRLAVIDEKQRVQGEERQLSLAEEANRIATEANHIAKGAAATSGKAYHMSVLAVLAALLAVVVTVV